MVAMSAPGRYCCKSLFALLIKNSKGYRRDFRVKMWGTSSPDDKLVSDLAKATEAIKIAARRSNRLMEGKLSPLNFGLLQQYRHTTGISDALANVCSSGRTGHYCCAAVMTGDDPIRPKRPIFVAMQSAFAARSMVGSS